VGDAEKASRRGTGEWGNGTKRLYNYYYSHTAKLVGSVREKVSSGVRRVGTEAERQFTDLRL
jgi:hypothetical protein